MRSAPNWPIRLSSRPVLNSARKRISSAAMFYVLAVNTWGREENRRHSARHRLGAFHHRALRRGVRGAFAAYHRRQYCVMVIIRGHRRTCSRRSPVLQKRSSLATGDEVIVPATMGDHLPSLQQYGPQAQDRPTSSSIPSCRCLSVRKSDGSAHARDHGVSILGNPARSDAMRKFADDRGLYFIEDNCESMDAELAAARLAASVICRPSARFFSHHISTMEGGMVTTDDRELFRTRQVDAGAWLGA